MSDEDWKPPTSAEVLLERYATGERKFSTLKQRADLQSAKLWRADLRDADLWRANLRDAKLGGADLRGANLGGADLRDASLGGADLRDASLGGADLRGAFLWDADLRGAFLWDAMLQNANLGDAKLQDANLQDADLRGAKLPGVDLRRTKLRGAKLQKADLQGANLGGAQLPGADLGGAKLGRANLQDAKLGGAKLGYATLWRADLRDANLGDAKLGYAYLHTAYLQGANLRGADLKNTDLQSASLQRADLRGANLGGAKLERTGLGGAQLQDASLGRTKFATVDLSLAIGLAKAHHSSGSPVAVDTLQRTAASLGKNPARQGEVETFLRGCGLPGDQISLFRSWVGVIQFYSTFVSYAHEDQPFVCRLHDALQGRGVRCWLDAHDLKLGDWLHESVDQAIRIHDKVVLCVSEAALESEWVGREIEKTLEVEQRTGRLALIPLDLDGYLFSITLAAPKHVRRLGELLLQRLVADFTGWAESNDKFEAQLARLLVALERREAPDTKASEGPLLEHGPPFDWTRDDARALWELLYRAYDHEAQARALAATVHGELATGVHWGQSARMFWRDLLEEACERRELGGLVGKMRADDGAAAYRQELRGILGE